MPNYLQLYILQSPKQARRATELWTADHMISEETQAKVSDTGVLRVLFSSFCHHSSCPSISLLYLWFSVTVL